MTYEYGTVCSETSAAKLQIPGNRPKERIQHSRHGENMKSRAVLMSEHEGRVSLYSAAE